MSCSRSMLRMCTAPVTQNAPAASITPQRTSNPIQIPQGNWSVMFDTAPNPLKNRTYVEYAPASMIATKTTRQNVILGIFISYLRVVHRAQPRLLLHGDDSPSKRRPTPVPREERSQESSPVRAECVPAEDRSAGCSEVQTARNQHSKASGPTIRPLR